MSETAAKKNDSGILRLTVTLLAICAACALVLGLVNMVTKDKIELNKNAEKIAAMQNIIPSDDYSIVTYNGSDSSILSAFQAGDKGHVIEVNCANGSYSGTLSILVGINPDGTVAGVEILSSGESPGLGDEAKQPEWRAQFVGKSGSLAINKDGGEIQALSGASMTSRSVTNGVNAALTAVGELG